MSLRARSGLLFAVLVEGGLLGLALLLGLLLGIPPLADFRLEMESVLLGVVGTLPPLALLAFLLRTPIPAFRQLMADAEGLLGPLFARCTVIELAAVAALAGVGEEALFRGVFQTWATDGLGPLLGIGLTSVVFGLAHFVSPLYAIIAAAVGTYVGIIYHLTGDLVAVMLVHGLYDLVALEILVRRIRSGSTSAL